MHTIDQTNWFYNDSGFAVFETPAHAISSALEIARILDADCSSAHEMKDTLLLIHRYALSLLQYRPDGLFEAWLSELVDMLECLDVMESGGVLSQAGLEVYLQYRDAIVELRYFIASIKTFPVWDL